MGFIRLQGKILLMVGILGNCLSATTKNDEAKLKDYGIHNISVKNNSKEEKSVSKNQKENKDKTDQHQTAHILHINIDDCVQADDTHEPLDISIRSLAKEENFISESSIIVEENEKHEDFYNTKLCWYLDGATVSISIPDKEIHQGEEFKISNLSDSVDEKSIIVRCPDSVILDEYKLLKVLPLDENKNKIKKTNILNNKKILSSDRFLKLNVHKIDKISENDLWKIQYSVKNVSWLTNHLIEFSSDKKHITFVTVIRVSNQSGIYFKNAQIQFLEHELPKDINKGESSGEFIQTYTGPSIIYKHYTKGDIAPNQDKMIVWNSAKRIAITTSNGLFVGGEFLKKMNETAYPQIENWISFPNIKEVGLGKSLPSGRVSVYHNRDGFVSLIGFANMNQVKAGTDVTIRMPPFLQYRSFEKTENEDDHLDAQLVQESYRTLTPTIAEAEYRLVLKNSKNTPVSLTVTIDTHKTQKYSLARSSINSYEKNKRGEVCWKLEIPPRGSRELRYKLTLRSLA